MARMTNKQIEHACDRLRSITSALLHELDEPDKPKMPDEDALIEDIANGIAMLTEKEIQDAAAEAMVTAAQDYYDKPQKRFLKNLSCAVYGRAHKAETGIYEGKKIIYDAAAAKVKKQAQYVEDQIILGDVEEALRLLAEFAEFKG